MRGGVCLCTSVVCYLYDNGLKCSVSSVYFFCINYQIICPEEKLNQYQKSNFRRKIYLSELDIVQNISHEFLLMFCSRFCDKIHVKT